MGKDETETIDMDFIRFIGSLIQKEQECEYVKVDSKIEAVKALYRATDNIFTGVTGSTLKFNNPFKGMGVITIYGKKMECVDPAGFVKISKAASNIDIYPETNGNVKIDFTFYGCEEKKRG